VVLAHRDSGAGVVLGDIYASRLAQCRSSLPALEHRVL
jgi:hypothetical protein